jgi:peptidoglycan-associated lipoprotein
MLFVLTGVLCVVLASCATEHPAPPKKVKPAPHVTQTMPTSATSLRAAQALAARARREAAFRAWMKAHPGLAERSVYFNFNRSRVHSRYEKMLKAQAQYLFSHARAVVRLEGNCDARGTVGYNLALGQKRAHAVAGLLESLGTNPAQVEVVSYGKQRPVARGNNPPAWAVNRRVDLVYVRRPPKGCVSALPGRDRSQPRRWRMRQLRRLKSRLCQGATFSK